MDAFLSPTFFLTWNCSLKSLLDVFFNWAKPLLLLLQQHIHNLLLLVFETFDILDLELRALKHLGGFSVPCEALGCSSEPLDLIPVSELLLSTLQLRV